MTLAGPRWVLALALAAATLGAYAQVSGFPFLDYDDLAYVVRNPAVAAGLGWDGVRWAFGSVHVGNWHPLTWLSHMLDAELYGLQAGGHHLSSLFLHILNTLLLFVLLERMTGALGRSAFAAAVFALHPLHVESVAWISERKDVLSVCFGLLALLAWQGYARSRARGPWLLAALLFAASLMSKAMLVTLPFVLLLLDVWPLERLRSAQPAVIWPLVREKLLMFALAAAGCVVAWYAQGDGVLDAVPVAARLANAATAYAAYLRSSLLPCGLSPFYPFDAELPLPRVAGAFGLLLVVSALALWQARRRPWLGLGWFWFLGTLVPVIGLVQIGYQSRADRYMYFPLIGLAITLSWGGYDLARRRIAPGALTAGAVALLLGCALATWQQLGYWRDELALFGRALEVDERGNFVAQTGYGAALAARGEHAAAIAHYERALLIHPDYLPAAARLGEAYLAVGEPGRALAQLERARDLSLPGVSVSYYEGLAYEALGRFDEAAGRYEAQLGLDPDHRQALARLAVIRAAHPDPAFRDAPRALALAQRACELSGYQRALELDVLATALANAGRFPEAIDLAERALAIADADGDRALAGNIAERLGLYRAGRPARLAGERRAAHPSGSGPRVGPAR